MSKNIKNEIIEIIAMWIYALFTALVIPSFLGFFGEAFALSEILNKFVFYYGFLFGGLMLVTALQIRAIVLARSEEGAVHDPTERPALLGNIPFIRDPVILYMFSVLFFGVLGLLAALRQTFFFGIPQLQLQQVSKFTNVYFSVAPAAQAESLFFMGLIFLSILFLGLFFRGKKPAGFFIIVYAVLPVIFALIWAGYHALVYKGDQPAILTVLIFGYLQSLLAVLVGSWIPIVVMHEQNNLFFALSQSFSNQTILIWAIIFLFLWLFLTIFIIVKRIKRAKKEF